MTFVTDPGSANPVFDYSSRDYASIYQDLVLRKPIYLPEWTSNSPSDFGAVLLQMFAYVGDIMGYYMDRLAGEAFIQTATQASSIINLAAMLDYQPTLSVGAVVTLQVTISTNTVGPFTIPAGTLFSTPASPTQSAVVFETTEALTIAGENAATPSTVGFVSAVQGTTFTNEAVTTSNGSVNQVYPLQNSPVSADSFTVSVDLGLGPQEWTYVSSLISSGPFDQVYTNYVDANGVFYVVFGDGVNGYVPPLGSPITCTYQTSLGSLGNVGAQTITSIMTGFVGVTAVSNPTAASGGADAESLASIQQNAPASLRTLNRAVALDDWSTLAIQVPGVQWASAEEATYQLINLFIAPFGGGSPSALLQAQVQTYIDPLSMANTTVTIYPPSYVPINITATVVLYSNYGNSATEQVILAALENILALSNTGFGFRVSLGLVFQTILAQLGVNYAIVTSLNREALATLTSPLTNATGYTLLHVSQLPQAVNAGDTLVLGPGGTPTQSGITVAAPGAPVGALSIPVNSFTTTSAFPLFTAVQDVTGTSDAVLLPNEIPIVGTLSLTVSGGPAGS